MPLDIKTLKRPEPTDGPPLLVLATNAAKPDDRARALTLLGQIADASHLPALQSILADASNPSEVRVAAAHVVSRIGESASIQTLSLDADPLVAVQAVLGAKKIGNEAVLQSLATHPNEIVSRLASEALDPDVHNDISDDWGDAHPDSPPDLHNTLLKGDCLESLKAMPSGCVHFTLTSPPYYNARDYSIYSSYNEYLDFLRAVFAEVRRVTKPGRHIMVNSSPVIMARAARQYESRRYAIPFDSCAFMHDIGWDFQEDIVWIKPEPSVKKRTSAWEGHRKPLSYRPNAVTEYLFVFRKRSARLIDWNISQYPPGIVEQAAAQNKEADPMTSNVWRLQPAWDATHSAVFPESLCERAIRAFSFPGDLVLDPFAGSGTTGFAAHALDRRYVLCERDPQYVERIGDRLKYSLKEIRDAENTAVGRS